MPASATFSLLIAFVTLPAPAQDAPIIKVHEGKFWNWYARQDQYQAHRADFEHFYQYADDAFDYLQSAWGLQLLQSKYALLVWPKTGGGFAAGDIDMVHGITGKTSP